MRSLRRNIIILILVVTGMTVAAQNFSNRGKEFWVGYGHHSAMEVLPRPIEFQEMVLYFSAEEAAHVVVTIRGTAYREEYDVPANSVIASKLIPRGAMGTPPSAIDARLWTRDVTLGGTNSEGLFSKHGIHIESDVPIVAYAHIYVSASSAATMLMPVESWGYAYTVLAPSMTTNYNTMYPSTLTDRYSWMYVVAKEDETRVRIIPSVPTRSGLPANVPIDITLQKGEIYQLMGAPTGFNGFLYDMAGTTVRSIANANGECHPIATFMGSSGQYIACPGAINGAFPAEDNLFQQEFPEHAWGKRYVIVPTCIDSDPTRHNVNFYRVMVKDPATVVKRNGAVLPSSGLSAKNFYEFSSNTADYIEADQPIQVAQMLPSAGACGYIGKGDPDFVFVSPIEQGIKRAGFYRNNKSVIDWNYLLLSIPTAGLTSLRIDGSNTFSNVYSNPNLPGYSVVVQQWRTTAPPKAPAQCIVQSDSAFTAVTYGLGNYETYAYNAGAYINNLSGFPFLKNQYNTTDTANQYTCVNTPVQLSVLLRYQPTKIQWKLSELVGIITPAVDTTDNSPVSVGTQLVNGVTYFKYTLPGYYRFSQAGKIMVPVYATHPSVNTCDNTEKIPYEIEVRARLTTDFSFLYGNCKLSELISFNARDTFDNGTVIKRWEWNFMNGAMPATASGKNVQQLFNAGNNSAELVAIDANACVADTTKQFKLSANPATPVFDAVPAFICEGGTITFTERNPEAGVQKWYWDFDNKDTVTVANGNPQVKMFGKYDTITVKHVVKFSDVCYSDTAVQQVIIYARPKLSIQYPGGCLPAGGVVQFTSLSSAPDGQAMDPSGYTWNFGDANASGANPNTAVIANPAHQYTNYGTYDILYQATTEKGCYRDTVIKATFNVRPQFSFGALGSVCENSSTPVSIAKATVTNGVPGSGVYKGKGVSANGMFTAALAGVGTHQVWYVFTTTQGCTDSIAQSISVLPKPTTAFTINSQICLDGVATIADQSSLSGGTVTNWYWNYGDGTSEMRNNAAAFTRNYGQAGSYTVQLVTLGNNGCYSDTVKHTLLVNPLPVAGFELPAAVCMPAGKAQFTNTSTISNGSLLSYAWNFGDNTASTAINPVHNYTASGSYQVAVTVTSAQGCTASTRKVLDQFYNQPVASFAVNAEELCQGTASLFSDNSAPANSSISSWQWAFGDGSTSTLKNPSKTYSQPGNFTIQLTVTDAVGCVSEPFSKTVQVYLQPVIDAGPSFTVKEGTIVQFKATANSPSLQFVWTPGQLLSNPNILQPSLKVMDDGVYKLTATGDHNCTASDELKVLVQRPVVVPNAFSPNGDGINDTWMIKNLILYPDAILEVYNRYGQMVYRSIGYNTPWDGRMNGNPVPIGVYYYVIQLRNGDPPIKGSVTIVR